MSAKAYSDEPKEGRKFTETFDKFYTYTAKIYDLAVKVLPFWKRWLNQALPQIQGRNVLEISFGTGYLLTKYSGDFESCGVDFNFRMVEIAKNNLYQKGLAADLQQGDVEKLPYTACSFDTIINTMAFTGYPNGSKALLEMKRVLRPGGILVLIDVNYPSDDNLIGNLLTRFWKASGDIIRDMDFLLKEEGFVFQDLEIGGFGSVHLYLCEKL